jgi:hypothetical protein
MVVARKIIISALVELGKEEPTTRDKWLTVDAWKSLLFTRYDFDTSIDFSTREFNKALNLLGAIRLKVSTGNLTGMHAREKCFRRKIENTKKPTEKKMFLLLASSKEVEPQEPTTMEDWEAALMASQAVVDEIFEETIPISSFSERALSNSLGPVDIEIARLRKKATPAPPRPVTPTTAPPPSLDAPPIPSSVPSTSYWDSAKARSLFQPRPEESVPVCLQRRIDLLNGVYNDWETLKDVLDDGEAVESELSSNQRQRLFHKCLFLRHAYEVALFRMNKGSSWANVCEEAIQDLHKIGIKTYTSS